MPVSKGRAVFVDVVEGNTIIAIEGDPLSEHSRTASKYPLHDIKLLAPVLPPTFYAIGSNYRIHVIERSAQRDREMGARDYRRRH